MNLGAIAAHGVKCPFNRGKEKKQKVFTVE